MKDKSGKIKVAAPPLPFQSVPIRTYGEMGEINYQDCCLSCVHHTGTRCGKTGRKKEPSRRKCDRYQINPSFDKEVKYDK